MRTLSICILALSLAAPGSARAGEADLTVPTVGTPPTIDGVLEEAAWADAAVIDDFHVLRSSADPLQATVCRLLRDENNLYIAVTCSQTEGAPQRTTTNRSARAYKDDSIEIFLAPRPGSGTYAHFAVSAGGGYREQMITGPERSDRDQEWSVSWRRAVTVDTDQWTVETAIPLYVIRQGLHADGPAFNVCRNLRSPAKQFITWAPLGKSYHEPRSFRQLGGFQDLDISPVCDPRIRSASARYYFIENGAPAYRVDLQVENTGGKACETVLALDDRPEQGGPKVYERTIAVPPLGEVSLQWDVPVSLPGPRAARVMADAGNREWIRVNGVASLTTLSVFCDRSAYTRETYANLVCRSVFTEKHSAQRSFQYSVSVTDADDKALFTQKVPQPGRETRVRIPLQTLDAGTYEISLVLTDAGGHTIDSARTELHRYAPGPSTEVKFDHVNEVILVDGQPFFPFGFMYCNALTNRTLMTKLADAGFNTIVRWYNVRGESVEEKIDTSLEGLNVARDLGLRVFEKTRQFGGRLRYGMPRETFKKNFDKMLADLEQALPSWRGHPAVIGYYGLDEPGEKMYSFAREMYALCHRIDPYRLMYSSSWNDWPFEAYEIFDLLGRHGYHMPVADKTGPLNKLSRRCAAMAETAARAHRPFVATPQFCWREEVRKITPHEMRCAYFLPLIQGAKGLIFFIYRDRYCHPAEWKAMVRIAGELKQVIPYLLTPSPPQNVTCDVRSAEGEPVLPPGPAAIATDFKPVMESWQTLRLPVIQTLIKNHPDGGEIIFAANSEKQDREVTFRLSTLGATTRLENFFTGETVERNGDTFNTRMPGYAVRVYRTKHSARKSPKEAVTMAIRAPAVGPAVSEQASGPNVLKGVNPGFETETLGDKWVLSPEDGLDVELSTEAPHSGDRCLSVNLTPERGGSVSLHDLPLKKNTRYRLSGWFRSRMTEGDRGVRVRMLVPHESDKPPRFSFNIPPEQPEWRSVERTFTTSEPVAARFSISYPAGRGRIDCDDLKLEDLGPVVKEGNRIVNASFEEATYFGMPDGWQIQQWTDKREEPLHMHERQVKADDAVHGEAYARSGNWLNRYPLGKYFHFGTHATIDFAEDHVLSIYLRTDQDDIPVKLVCRETGRHEAKLSFETEITVDAAWQRYTLELPLADKQRRGRNEVFVGVKGGKRCLIYADAAQLETGLTPTAFEVDEYRAVDLGPQYSREAVLGENAE